MSTRTGFTRMDWDTGFLADPKFQHLRDLLPEPIRFGYAGFCYLRLAADAWRTCDRDPIGTVVRGIEPWATDALREAGLVDTDGRIPEESFDHWTGTAIRGRQATADAQKRHRESRSVTVTNDDSSGVTRSQDSARTGRTGRTGQVKSEEGVQGEFHGISPDEASVFALIADAGASVRPETPMGIRVLGLIERNGSPKVRREVARISKAAGRKLSDRQIVFGVEAALEAVPTSAEARQADLAEDDRKRAAKRQAAIDARRLEQFHWTGKWDTAWGPQPEGVS